MWNVWHGSKLERRLFGNKGEKQPLLSGHQGNAEATQQYADLMWRASSPQGLYDQQHRSGSAQHFAGTDSNSADSTRPGTPPTNAGGLGNHSFADPGYGYQQLLEPLLPTGDLLHSSGQAPAQHPAQDQQHHQSLRTRSFLIMPAVPAPSSPLQRPPSHHSHSPQPSEDSHGYQEPSHGNLQGLNDPQDLSRQMKRIGSGQLMVTEGDKVMLPANLGLIGASRMAPQPTQHQQLLLHSIQEDGSSQVHAVPMTRAPELGLQHGEAARMWKEQVKWVLLWFTLSLLTCMHSAALILALQYNLIAVAFGGMFCISGLLGIYGSCATLAGYCMSRHFGVAGVNVFKLKQMEVLAFTTMVISALAAIIHFASVNIIHNEGTGAVPGGHICNPGDVACEQNYNFVIVMMVSTTVFMSSDSTFLGSAAAAQHKYSTVVRPICALEYSLSSRSLAIMTIKIVAVFPKGGEASKNDKYVNCVENALGLREWCEKNKADLVVTESKDGDDSELAKHIKDMEILITTPFHPAYMTKERLEKASKLKLIMTAGVGSDHIDLQTAADKGMTVVEVSGSNVTSVAEDEVMRILVLIRNYLPARDQVMKGDWDVPAVAVESWDLMDKTVGTVGGGRIGYHMMKRLRGWDVKRVYFGRHNKPDMDEEGVELIKDLDEFLKQCDVVSINVPLSDKTKNMFSKEVIGKMKKGAYLVNNARGAIVDREAVVEACKSGQLGGYSGDVWDEQPPSKDHPWKKMPKQAMTPHTSGTTLDAQVRYQKGIQVMLDQWVNKKPFEEDNYIVREGKLAGQYS
ncbi:hypothetical protein WJX79_009035 [Trebouxia sp. C0005]